MKIEIVNKHGESTATNTLVQRQETPSSYNRNTYSTAEKYWTSEVTEISSGNYHIATHDIVVKEQFSLKTYDAPEMIGLLFLEKGSMKVKKADGSFREMGGLQHSVVCNAKQTEETAFCPGQEIKLTTIHIAPEHFFKLTEGGSNAIDRMANNVYKGSSHKFATDHNQYLSPRMLSLLNSFESPAYNNASLRLLTEAKVLELLSLQIAQIEEDARDPVQAKLSEHDVRQLNLAREFILTDVSYTPSLEDISLQVGINMYKLKTGFKALFGRSVFNYLREERLELAYKEATKRSLPLTEIAYLTGFASVSHFSDAFKKRYGVAPSQVRN